MNNTEADLDLGTFLELTEDLDITPRCESVYCAEYLGKDSHDAEWLVAYTCGDNTYWCSDRLALYQAEDYNNGVKCFKHPQPIVVWLTGMAPVHP